MSFSNVVRMTLPDFGEPPEPPEDFQLVCPVCEGEEFLVFSSGIMECVNCGADAFFAEDDD